MKINTATPAVKFVDSFQNPKLTSYSVHKCPKCPKLVSKEVMDESFTRGNVDRQLTIVKITQVMEIRKKEVKCNLVSQDWLMHVGPSLCAVIAVI